MMAAPNNANAFSPATLRHLAGALPGGSIEQLKCLSRAVFGPSTTDAASLSALYDAAVELVGGADGDCAAELEAALAGAAAALGCLEQQPTTGCGARDEAALLQFSQAVFLPLLAACGELEEEEEEGGGGQGDGGG